MILPLYIPMEKVAMEGFGPELLKKDVKFLSETIPLTRNQPINMGPRPLSFSISVV